MPSQHKKCTKCGEEKPLSEYHKNKSRKVGIRSQCKECANGASNRYRAENREKIREQRRRRYAENPEIHREHQDRYRDEHRESLNVAAREPQRKTRQLADSFATVPLYSPWLPGEDALLLADNGMTMYQKSIELGRTYSSCKGRLYYIRK